MSDHETVDYEPLTDLYGLDAASLQSAFDPEMLGRRSPALTSPDSDHGDVFELERIATLVYRADARSVIELPGHDESLESEYPLLGKVRHAKSCTVCIRGIQGFIELYPTHEQLAAARSAHANQS